MYNNTIQYLYGSILNSNITAIITSARKSKKSSVSGKYTKELKKMTLRELYSEIGGDYEQAVRVLRMDKLIDKHIRKLTKNGAAERLIEAGKSMDPTELFEAAHAVMGVCANLGLSALSESASEIAEEYRTGKPRKLSDAEVSARLRSFGELYKKTADGIQKYEEG